ncbi:MAG: MBOAT family protein [Lachnospiraceae bacterium]|nr:MBOAT family protein [Lachnospiraceae bacterium]
MLFNSFEFVLFFPIVVIIYLILPKRLKPIGLLLASYYFYMCWNAKYIILILFTTLITYVSALLIEHFDSKKNKKALMITGITVNLLVLFLFKYFDFFINNINFILAKAKISQVNNPFDFLLPVGISFYTFQAIGYVIDVYRGETKAERNIINYALFVSFFPQLVAGPIERSKNLLSQIRSIREKNLFSYDSMVSGFGLMLWGLFLKTMIADRAAVVVDKVFSQYYLYGTVELILAALLFTLQIYADFSGYSAIAIGAARVMGIKLCTNFDTPYFAVSIADFWSRWHISLSTWFKDYVYIPLGGNRKGKVRKYFNLIITFLVSGLWHGASWNFVAWGLLHGFYRVIGEVTGGIRNKCYDLLKVKRNVFSFNLLKRIITFALVSFAWIFFRAKSIKVAFEYIKRMFTHFNPWAVFNESIYSLGLNRSEFSILMLCIILLFAVSLLNFKKKQDVGTLIASQNLWFRWAVYIGLVVIILVYGEYGIDFSSSKFIYFDF